MTVLDFSFLESLYEFSNAKDAVYLVEGLHVNSRRYGGNYCAALTFMYNDGSGAKALDIYNGDEGYEHALCELSWFPYREGKTIQEALSNLLNFINNELTRNKEQLINWASACSKVEKVIIENGFDHMYNKVELCLPPLGDTKLFTKQTEV